jgi:uncharacterized protein (TIGR03032 family)
MNQVPMSKPPVRIECSASEAFRDWLARADGAMVVTTYQAGKVAVIGWDGARVTLLMREFDKPLGMAIGDHRMVLATRNDVWLLANAPLLAADYLEDQPGRYDALYLPRATYHTGDLNVHDVALSGEDVILVNTRFSCLAKLSADHSFTPFWRPRFVTDLVPEDRCHLNGLAMRDGRPKYVTALGTTDEAGAWREKKATGGVVIDVETGDVVAGGLAMPHSPRWHDGRLWVLNSGAGELLALDPATGRSEVVCALSGYLRGLCFVGPYAMVGLCKIREKHIFGGLPIQERFAALRCAVAVIDLRDGREAGTLEFTAGCEELYDVQFLPGARRPMILNLEKSAAREAMTNPDSSFWLRPSSEIRDEADSSDRAGRNRARSWPAGPPVGESLEEQGPDGQNVSGLRNLT